jgi:hypothetical protein
MWSDSKWWLVNNDINLYCLIFVLPQRPAIWHRTRHLWPTKEIQLSRLHKVVLKSSACDLVLIELSTHVRSSIAVRFRSIVQSGDSYYDCFVTYHICCWFSINTMIEVVSILVVIDHFIKNKNSKTGTISLFAYHVSEFLTCPFLNEVNQSISRSSWMKYLSRMIKCMRIVWDKRFHPVQCTDESSWQINERKMSSNIRLHWLMAILTFMVVISAILLFVTTNRHVTALVLDVNVSERQRNSWQ